ncbi:SusC/RagA family TonB-linked outer membrane protein [Flavobacterium cellulosilyticum]|uniref:SusC/RagA family TonB-linked outer membrane protein n=1 Tax=Flavobacterium cellulosilyticum TaxID=2541731 RepID=A0A4R5CIA4_9FLAO|nr:SusC/RagA family TonB-linked outer membrane protein [Flavobacterium cellulosilyticum]TDD99505.1 SusC/RagA family TonB-linked outer membrane protein [Flavobacterium cellulosilyticum]
MRYIQLKIVLCFLIIAFSPTVLIAQVVRNIDVNGSVRSAKGEPVMGATLVSKKGNISTTTDFAGKFTINVPINSNLLINATGFVSKSVVVTPKSNEIEILLDKDQSVQVAFRKVQEKDLLGDVSYVNIPEILKNNYTTYSLDGLQTFVGGFNGNIWGAGGYLVLVDGIPRDATSILPVEIEQVSFLKGVAAVALYGSRAAKGVVYITSKKGVIQKQQIAVRFDAGINLAKSFPKYLGSAEYMSYYNQARSNDGLSPLYSQETIYNYASGSNPYRFPNVDYYSSDYLKDFAKRYDANVEIKGGNKIARYYTVVNFSNTGDLLNFGEAKKNNTNRFNIRGNVDLAINDFISCTIGTNAIYYNGRGVNTNYWNSAANTRPNRFSPLLPTDMIEESDQGSQGIIKDSNYLIDGKYLLGGTQLDLNNSFAAIYAGGYNTYTNRQFQFNTGVNANLNSLLDGLSFKSKFAVDYETSYSQSYNNNYAVYEAAWNNYAGNDQITSLTKYGDDSKSGIQNISNSAYKQTIAFSGQFDYEKKIEGGHNFSAMLIANGFQQALSQVYHKVSNANLGLNLSYNFAGKYYAEFNEAVVHSAKFAKGKRLATSPTLSLGWRLSQENFLKDWSSLDNLKLTVSAGILNTDLDVSNYYLYQSIYTQTDGAWFSWRDGSLNRSTDSRRGENLDLSYATRNEVNVGLEASFLKKLITFNGTFFANKIKGNPIQASVLYPNYFSTGFPNTSFIPYVNYNNDDRIGFDFNVRFNKRVGQVDLSLGVTGNYYDSKASKRAEQFENDYQNRQGKPIDALWGLKSEGFFMNDSDIVGHASQTFGTVKPGDIKYHDQNGDGVINSQDEVYLGKAGWSGSPFTGGINFTAKWKTLTFFALATTQIGAYGMKNNSYFWIDGEDKYSVMVRNSWTVENQATATYPRLTTNTSDNNYRSSDFWIYSTNRIDLANVQISYDFPKKLIQNSFLSELGVYVNGSNLLTISPERETMELNIGGSPQTRFFNLGLKALF